MSIKLYHGAPGSFKTASAVWYDVIKWLEAGRKVYTNIRGVADIETIQKVVKKTFPDTAEVITVSTDSEAERQSFGAWFHWLPPGAALIIDEAQFIYDSRYKPEYYDYPGGLDAAVSAGVPFDIKTAVDKHRHYNWDIVLTSPNQKKLPAWFVQTVETAYHHKNMEHVPLFGRRRARVVPHIAGSAVPAITKKTQVEWRKIPVAVHQIYGSTATGKHIKNDAEKSPLKSKSLILPAILLVVAIIALPVALSMRHPASVTSAEDVSARSDSSSVDRSRDDDHAADSAVDPVALESPAAVAPILDPRRLELSASVIPSDGSLPRVFRIAEYDQDRSYVGLLGPRWLDARGISYRLVSSCRLELTLPDGTIHNVYCGPSRPPVERSSGTGGAVEPAATAKNIIDSL